MSTMHEIGQGLGRLWESLSAGWRQLSEHASHALTRFTPSGSGDVVTAASHTAASGSGWGLLVADVTEDNTHVVVRLEVPGMDKDDFDIRVKDDILVVRGEKRVTLEDRRGRYHVMECAYGRFERAIALPESVSDDAARASYRDGVLKIVLSKVTSRKQRRIRIRSA